MKKIFGYIYLTTNRVNSKKYIGKAITNRKNNHENYLGSGILLKKAIKKYGKENFRKDIICLCFNKAELEKQEEYFIDLYNAVNRDDFYNLKKTSIGGDTFTTNPKRELIREKHRKNAIGKNNPMYERIKNEKIINSIKKANSQKIKVNNILYNSQTDASKALGIGLTTINYRLNSDNFPNYKRITSPKKTYKKKHNNKKIRCKIYDIEYDSIAEAAKALGKSPSYIRRRINFDSNFNYL